MCLYRKLVIEHKDRLTRFQFKFIKKMFESYGCEVIVINGMDVSDTEELAADMMSLLASFSGKLKINDDFICIFLWQVIFINK